jgi:hypothetical protein
VPYARRYSMSASFSHSATRTCGGPSAWMLNSHLRAVGGCVRRVVQVRACSCFVGSGTRGRGGSGECMVTISKQVQSGRQPVELRSCARGAPSNAFQEDPCGGRQANGRTRTGARRDYRV